MMINTEFETLVAVSQLSKVIPGRVHSSTGWRWVQRGVRGIKLETILIGGRRYTSHEALQRFFERTTAAAAGELPPVRTAKQRERDIARAERELADAGI
jgi:hypothetical protein